ncbi:hypothetical protein XAP412_30005 [Xanthomonas phaseoli pv. phaseoli]|uniref:Secreted protein n=1 Tax=Xanthomonas campestris pv. phaseoli TaxID=317013 RepID=A0AB38DZ32_XANCH|nr:hypothetical protein XAP6984_40005 [Xanthomonas phaseoli pv. phaseoli]SON83587.1 hypothetical protein XAP412_30005 [Xanthomonas phaseoli pv. phaseoli]SON87432.1 hypothetical protein XAP7430_30005 [Xanthomonas phaseoli pv. phaseoli]SOO30081.1 hypothetical protein XAP6164_40005 [Xanthomonas phaseoli pv. phaseoli]
MTACGHARLGWWRVGQGIRIGCDIDVHSVVHGPTQTTSTRTVALRPTWHLRRVRQPVRHDGPGRYRLLRLQGGRIHATGILAILALPSVQGGRLVLHMLRGSQLHRHTARRHRR